jgi:hypothetical protein
MRMGCTGSWRRVLLAVVCCGMAACATTAKYEQSLDAMKGGSEADLVRSFGPPIEVFNSNGHRFLVYQVVQTATFEPMRTRSSGSYDYSTEQACTTVFDVLDGRVLDWAIKGNNCRK